MNYKSRISKKEFSYLLDRMSNHDYKGDSTLLVCHIGRLTRMIEVDRYSVLNGVNPVLTEDESSKACSLIIKRTKEFCEEVENMRL